MDLRLEYSSKPQKRSLQRPEDVTHMPGPGQVKDSVGQCVSIHHGLHVPMGASHPKLVRGKTPTVRLDCRQGMCAKESDKVRLAPDVVSSQVMA